MTNDDFFRIIGEKEVVIYLQQLKINELQIEFEKQRVELARLQNGGLDQPNELDPVFVSPE